MTTTRQRAVLLLDALRHREPGDRTLESVTKARSYRSAVASGLYPMDALQWAWADPAADRENPQPGELDKRRFAIVEGRREITAFGAMYGWLKPEDLPEGTLVLAGREGSGKDVAGMYAAAFLGGSFYFAPHITDLPLGESPVLRALERVPFLVLGELGREGTIGNTQQRVVALLTWRHDNGYRTLVTTNLPAETADADACFVGRYGKHLLDRVRTSGKYFELAGTSRRQLGVFPKLDGIQHHCRVADLVEAVNSLSCAQETDVPPSVIDELAAEFHVTDEQIEAAIDRRRSTHVVPHEMNFGHFGHLLRVAAGLEAPAPFEKREAHHGT